MNLNNLPIILLIIFLCYGFYVAGRADGNKEGDQLTLRDCAVSGEAILRGGATIECKVKLATKVITLETAK